MPRPRANTAGLSRLLGSLSEPVYLLDNRHTIVFCNDACLDWVGQNPDDLLGQRCAYHSSVSVTGPEAVAAGLCPPPAAWQHRQSTAVVACTDTAGHVHRRRAQTVLLGDDADEPAGLIVIVAADDASPDDATPESPPDEAEQLHQRVRAFHAAALARSSIDRLVGDSPAMRLARSQVELAIGSRATVLVVGPSGSGRQSIADATHYGNRTEPRGTLIPIACSVLGAELIQSTLSAVANKTTLGEKAATSTLLLSDADLLPVEIQGPATTILAARSFPLRIVATSRQPLVQLAQQGQYRADLAAALSTLVIQLPPLAERRQDIPLLAQLFLEEINAHSPRQRSGFTSEALDCLAAYPWPGNVDELILMVSESHARADGPEVDVTALPERIHLATSAAAHPRPAEQRIVLEDFLGRIERELIGRAIARAKGNKTKAAKLLGMTRPRLYRRLVQLGFEQPDGR